MCIELFPHRNVFIDTHQQHGYGAVEMRMTSEGGEGIGPYLGCMPAREHERRTWSRRLRPYSWIQRSSWQQRRCLCLECFMPLATHDAYKLDCRAPQHGKGGGSPCGAPIWWLVIHHVRRFAASAVQLNAIDLRCGQTPCCIDSLFSDGSHICARHPLNIVSTGIIDITIRIASSNICSNCQWGWDIYSLE